MQMPVTMAASTLSAEICVTEPGGPECTRCCSRWASVSRAEISVHLSFILRKHVPRLRNQEELLRSVRCCTKGQKTSPTALLAKQKGGLSKAPSVGSQLREWEDVFFIAPQGLKTIWEEVASYSSSSSR